MRTRTLVVVICAAAVSALAWPLAEYAESAVLPPLPRSVVPMPVRPAQPPAHPRLKLIVGDTFRVKLRANSAIGLASMSGGIDSAQTRFVSSDTSVAEVVNGGIIAKRPGIDTITATQLGAQGAAGVLIIEVMTPQQAVNDMAAEVCPNEADARFIRASQPLTTDHDPIHEFHDCQRLMDGKRYTVLAGIFAHQNVREHEDWQDFENGLLVATVINLVGDSAQVYRPLGLQPGTNCLILRAESEEVWRAALVPQRESVMRDGGRSYEQCEDRVRWDIPEERWRLLEVKLQFGVNMDGEPIAPPVARWDWDRKNWHNYMGVKCGAARWCEIGRSGFLPSKPLRIGWPKKREVIKGYYDQQYLADATGNNPTSVFGTIHPGDALEKLGKMKHQEARWYEVAEIELHETATEKSEDYWRYVRKFAGKSWTDALLGNTKEADLDLRPDPDARDITRLYKGRLDGDTLATGAVVYHYHGHLKDMPPTVRWRWIEDDERTWSFCDPEGCCETARLLTDN